MRKTDGPEDRSNVWYLMGRSWMESCCYGDGWKMLRDFIEIQKGESVMDGNNNLWDESKVGWWWVRVK